MKTEDLTVIETKGNLKQRAEQFGQATRSNYESIFNLYGQTLSLRDDPRTKIIVNTVKSNYLTESNKYPLYAEHIACGLNVSLESLLDLSICALLSKAVAMNCSGFAITRNGHTVVGQNIDTTCDGAAPLALEIGRNSEGPDTVRLCPVFPQDFAAGISPSGIALGSCSGPNGIDTLENYNGVTPTLWGEILFARAQNLGDIVEMAKSMPVIGRGINSVYTDSQRKLWIQYGGGCCGIEKPETPYCAATCYRTKLRQLQTPQARQDKKRWLRFMELGQQAMQKSGDLVEDVKTIMADHYMPDGSPINSPCRHGDEVGDTQYSFIFDITNRMVFYCGQPCKNEWRSIVLE